MRSERSVSYVHSFVIIVHRSPTPAIPCAAINSRISNTMQILPNRIDGQQSQHNPLHSAFQSDCGSAGT